MPTVNRSLFAAVTKQRLLDAMHRSTAATKVAVTPVPNVMVYTSGKKMPMVVEGSGEYSWLLTTEEGTQYKGHNRGGERCRYRPSCRKVITR
ncbi:4-alpha-glucanotransferase [Escherichia coli]|nr:4-alpha-glucanotransferase [Escherichia coli]